MSEQEEKDVLVFSGSNNIISENDFMTNSTSGSELTDLCSFLSLNSTDSIVSLMRDKNCFRHSTGWTVFFCLVYSLILICGLVGNSLVILILVTKSRMRTVTNMFILNLAVADLFVIVFCVPATLLANIFIPWVLGSFMCSAVAYVQGVSIFSSVYSLVAVSVDRCRAIYRPMDISKGLSKPQALISVTLIWVIAALITLPWYYVFKIVQYPEHTGQIPYCIEVWPSNKLYGQLYFLFVHLLLCYCLPLILIIIFNSVIWKSVSSRQIPQNPSSSSVSTTVLQIDHMHRTTKLRVLKMLTVLTFCFFISFLPLYCVMTRLKFFGMPEEHHYQSAWEMELIEIVIPLAQLLGSSNSCANPIFYTFFNRKFRETLKSLLSSAYCCCCCRYFGIHSRHHHHHANMSWRRRTNETHQTSVPQQTLNTITLDRTTLSRRNNGSSRWSRSSRTPSPCPMIQMTTIGSPHYFHDQQQSTTALRKQSSDANTHQHQTFTYSNTVESGGRSSSKCMCSNF